jgi:hypothetical protein
LPKASTGISGASERHPGYAITFHLQHFDWLNVLTASFFVLGQVSSIADLAGPENSGTLLRQRNHCEPESA